MATNSPWALMGAAERRVLEVRSDGQPHGETELRRVVFYPREWIKALREDGYTIEERNGEFQLLPKEG